jgi:hypothetical protein
VPAKAVEPDVDHRPARGAAALTAHQDLAAVGRRRHPGRGVDRQPDVTPVGKGGVAAVQSGPDRNRKVGRPGGGDQTSSATAAPIPSSARSNTANDSSARISTAWPPAWPTARRMMPLSLTRFGGTRRDSTPRRVWWLAGSRLGGAEQ